MYKIAIPSYKRADVISLKTLRFLEGIDPSRIYIFVASEEEKNDYQKKISREKYGEIIVGKLGIVQQRNFIRYYFDEGDYVISIDDDIEELSFLGKDGFEKVIDIDYFFNDMYLTLQKLNLFIWGIYPTRNDFYIKCNKHDMSLSLTFLIGCMHGYIVRHDKSLDLNVESSGKEDIEQSILYYLKDNGIVRMNRYAVRTKFYSEGGLGKITDRFEINRSAGLYLERKYGCSLYERKNGMTECRISLKKLKDRKWIAGSKN